MRPCLDKRGRLLALAQEERRCLLALYAGCCSVEPVALHGGFSGSKVLQV